MLYSFSNWQCHQISHKQIFKSCLAESEYYSSSLGSRSNWYKDTKNVRWDKFTILKHWNIREIYLSDESVGDNFLVTYLCVYILAYEFKHDVSLVYVWEKLILNNNKRDRLILLVTDELCTLREHFCHYIH